jgi:CRISPR-associated protein Cas2
VLEGEITKGNLERLEGEIDDLLIETESVVIYEVSSGALLNRTVYGDDPMEDQRFL